MRRRKTNIKVIAACLVCAVIIRIFINVIVNYYFVILNFLSKIFFQRAIEVTFDNNIYGSFMKCQSAKRMNSNPFIKVL